MAIRNEEREPAWSLNLYTLTPEAMHELWEVDRKLVGTEHYMGLCYFHNHGYRFIMRDEPTISTRRRIHAELLKRGLKVGAMSREHNEVIAKFLTGIDCPMSGTPWTRQEILDYDLSLELN
tara:strand:- start:192 stop:554 length:363 start_codon:yes stop_codon:yes gene_type:complete